MPSCDYCGMKFPTQIETKIHMKWSDNRGGCEMTDKDLSTCIDCDNYGYVEPHGHCCRLSKKVEDPTVGIICFRWVHKEGGFGGIRRW